MNIEDEAAADIRRRIRALGARFDAEVLARTREIYQRHVNVAAAAHERQDIAYGNHPRHRLDLYLPTGRPAGAIVFFHGGGFVAGDKNQDGTFYRNVGRYFASQGLLAVLPNYRLAPDHPWPAGAEDVGAALAWLRDNAAGLGVDAARVVVLGQSAGACHLASWLFGAGAGPGRRGEPITPAGVLLMSGLFQVQAPLGANQRAYFGADEALYPARSVLAHVAPLAMPIWLSVAEFDPGPMAAHTFELAGALGRCQPCAPQFAWLPGHNHVSTVHSLGTVQTDVASAIMRFVRACLP